MSAQGKPVLSFDLLLANGFTAVAKWTYCPVNGIKLDSSVSKSEGVYAFAVDGTVLYIGVATRSFATRMSGYCKPGPTQSTNKRLKVNILDALERGCTVDVCLAMPCDFEWHDLPVRGASGLEFGLIKNFSLPWNKQGK